MRVLAAYVAVVLLWSTTPLAIKWSAEGPGYLFGVTGRMVIGLICIGVAGILLRRSLPWGRKARLCYLAGAIQIYGSMLSTYWGAQFIPSGWMSVVFGLTPLITAVLSHFWLGENSLTPGRLAAYALGLGGLALMFGSAAEFGPGAAAGIGAILLASLLQAVSSIWMKRLNAHVPALAQVGGALVFAVPAYTWTWSLADGVWPENLPLRSIASIFYLGVIATTAGFALYFYLLKHLPATRVALLTLATPALSLWVGHWANGEAVTSNVIMGTALILAALVWHEFVARPRITRPAVNPEPQTVSTNAPGALSSTMSDLHLDRPRSGLALPGSRSGSAEAPFRYFSPWLPILSLIWLLVYCTFFPDPVGLAAQNWPLVLLGVLGALIGNLTAIGGGVVFIPVMMFVYRIDPVSALKLAFVTQAVGMSSGAAGWLRRGQVPLQWLPYTVPALVLGSAVSTFVLHPNAMLVKSLFGPVSIVAGLLAMFAPRAGSDSRELPAAARWTVPLAAFAGGLITGWVAIGEGEFIAAFCMLVYGLRPDRAVGLGVVLLAVNSLLLATVHAIHFGGVPWDMAIFTMLGVLWGGRLGPYLGQWLAMDSLKRFFAWIAILDGLMISAQAARGLLG